MPPTSRRCRRDPPRRGAETEKWLSSWTIFYWAWWISWTPFVGMFLARISRGRTIRQFVIGVILIPTTVSLIWFVVFGGAGIGQQRDGIDIFGSGEPESTLFGMLGNLPLAGLSSLSGHGARRDLLRVGCRRRVDGDGHAVPERLGVSRRGGRSRSGG